MPADKDNQENIVRVVDIDYYSKDNLPIALEYIKHIISKCLNDNFEEVN